MNSSPSPPLRGVRVVEIGAFMAAPFAAMQLADLGAEVIKVENPDEGDPVRSSGPFLDGCSSPFVRLNRNKRSVALDLKHERGWALLDELLGTADVLVQNLRPGALQRLDLGFEQVQQRHPRLVYVSASGWGQDGPLAPQPGLDIMAQARSGLMSITGHPQDPPTKVGVPVADLTCGLYAALAAVSALRARETSGVGQHVDVSLFESAVSLQVWEAGTFFATGQPGRRHGSAHQNGAPYQAVRTADGWVTVGANTDKTWQALCGALALQPLLNDERYVSSYQRYQHRDELIADIEAATGELDTEAIVALLVQAGVPCAPLADTAEAFTDEHLTARDFFWDSPHPQLGAVRQLGSPMRMSQSPPRRGAAGPGLGADTAAVLAELGVDEAELDELCAAGAAAVEVRA